MGSPALERRYDFPTSSGQTLKFPFPFPSPGCIIPVEPTDDSAPFQDWKSPSSFQGSGTLWKQIHVIAILSYLISM